jgi:hypothetical protein
MNIMATQQSGQQQRGLRESQRPCTFIGTYLPTFQESSARSTTTRRARHATREVFDVDSYPHCIGSTQGSGPYMGSYLSLAAQEEFSRTDASNGNLAFPILPPTPLYITHSLSHSQHANTILWIPRLVKYETALRCRAQTRELHSRSHCCPPTN